MKIILALILLLAPLASAAVMAPPELATGVFAVPLHSRPSASAVAYLDFTTVPSTATPEQVEETWRIVSAAYSPFNIDVTTEFPGYRANVAWCVIGGPFTDGHAGITPQVGLWTIGTQYAQYSTAFSSSVYADGYANDPTLVGQTCIHEFGHAFGCKHQPDGYMDPYIDPTQNYWGTGINEDGVPQDSAAVIGAATGLAPVPEPSVLLLACGMMLMRRGRR